MLHFTLYPVSAVDSTNNYLRELKEQHELSEGTVILSDFQSMGKGRGRNAWYSGKGLNILMSVLLYPKIPATKLFYLTEIASLAITDMLKVIGIAAEIKWPNDIYVQDKKIAGILIENVFSSDIIESSIIGIGLNVNETEFPSDLPNPVSVKSAGGKENNRNNLVKKLLEAFKSRYEQFLGGQLSALHIDYNALLYRKNKQCNFVFRGRNFQSTILLVKENGEIILQNADGEQRKYAFGELEMLL